MKRVTLTFDITDDGGLRAVTIDYNDTGINDVLLLKRLPVAMLKGIADTEDAILSKAKSFINQKNK